MNIKIGTLVLCHLLSPKNGNNPSEQQKIQQMPGIVKEIVEDFSYQMIESDYAIKRKEYILIVEPEDKEKIFKINADACRPIIEEEDHKKIVKSKSEKKQEKQQKEEIKDVKNLTEEKKDLLKQLE